MPRKHTNKPDEKGKKTSTFSVKKDENTQKQKKKKQKSNSTPKGSQQAGEAQEVDLGRYSGAAALPMNILQKLHRWTRRGSQDQRGDTSDAGFISESTTFIYRFLNHYCFLSRSWWLWHQGANLLITSVHTDHYERLFTNGNVTSAPVGVVVASRKRAHGTAHRESSLWLGYTFLRRLKRFGRQASAAKSRNQNFTTQR